jgi:hypothetical protein
MVADNQDGDAVSPALGRLLKVVVRAAGLVIDRGPFHQELRDLHPGEVKCRSAPVLAVL